MENNVRNIRIGDVLKEYGYVTDEQVVSALAYQKQNKGVKLGEALIAQGAITEKQMLQALAKRLSYRVVAVSDLSIDIEAVRLIPKQLAEKYCMLAVNVKDGILGLLVNDPMNFYGIEDIRQLTGMHADILLCERTPLEEAIKYYYSEVDARSAAQKANTASAPVEEIVIEDADDDTPIINLLNSLINRAYSTGASDIHIEPFESKTSVRMRIDGTIIDYVTLQKSLHASLIARIKILSELDIAERRIPQDGHFKMPIDGNDVNIRVSLIPTVYGEKAVMRLLAMNTRIDKSGTFGMNEESYKKFYKMLSSPNGIVYLTGPTGSGKSTTLYMVLETLSDRQINISTIEDPVEKNVAKINQMQVNNQAGLTFESGLRALLRQDPDIIMVGETRDAETASISVRAAITGHLVFSTLHTNDAASSVIRLKDMGLPAYMVASSLVGVVAQRLMRKVCPDCCESTELTEDEIAFVGRDLGIVKRAKGCHLCNYTGYRGRMAIHEILLIDSEIKRMINANADVDDIKAYAVAKQEMTTLKDAGIKLVESGITTMEELIKVAYNS